jgi:hypothetical protein
MTKKDYELIAYTFKKELDLIGQSRLDNRGEVGIIVAFAKTLARNLQYDNPAFSTEKFFKACGIGILS